MFLFPSIAPAVAETPSHRMREYRVVPSSGPEVGSVAPFTSESYAKSPVTDWAPVPDDTAVVTVPPPSKLRRPSWPPQVVHVDSGTSHSRPLVLPYKMPSFASDTPGQSSSTAAQQSPIGSTRQTSTGSGCYSSGGRRWTEGVSLSTSVVTYINLSFPETHGVPMRTSVALVLPTQ